MADDGQPRPRAPSCLAFLTDGLLLPGRNLGIFVPLFALNVACVGFADHAYSLALQGVLRPNDMAAAYLLCAFVGPAVRVVTASAAVFAANPERRAPLSWRSLVLDTLRSSGPVATAVDGYILLAAAKASGAVVLHLLHPLVVREDYLTPPLIEALVALRAAHRFLQGYVRAVSSIAVVSSPSQPGAIRRAWRLARENATGMAVFVAADELLADAILQWHDDAVERALDYGNCAACVDIVWYAYVLLSGARAMFSLCVAAAFYSQCSQSADPAAAAGWWQWLWLWTRGIEWLRCWISQCSNSLGDILQGRSSIRQVLATIKTKLHCWCLRTLPVVSGHPFVFSILAGICAWLAIEGIPSIFIQNDLLLYRASLRATHHSSLHLREHGICPKPKVRYFNPLSPWDRADNEQAHIHQVHTGISLSSLAWSSLANCKRIPIFSYSQYPAIAKLQKHGPKTKNLSS